MVEWLYQLSEREFEQALGDGEGQGSLACCRPWGRKDLDTTERLNNNNLFNGASLVVHMVKVKNLPACRSPGFDVWVSKILWRREWQSTSVFLPREFHG